MCIGTICGQNFECKLCVWGGGGGLGENRKEILKMNFSGDFFAHQHFLFFCADSLLP